MNSKWWYWHHKIVVHWVIGILGMIGLLFGVLLYVEPVKLIQRTVWSNLKELVVLTGGIVAVITYFRNGMTRRQDITFRKFDKTIEAEQYFRDEIAPTIQQTVLLYHKALVARGYFEMQDSSLKLMVVRSAVAQVNFSNCFKQLNTLAAYSRYKMVNTQQLYSNIADDVKYLSNISDFYSVQTIFNEQYKMNDYQIVIRESLAYLDQIKEAFE
jgi:hypothetical protein